MQTKIYQKVLKANDVIAEENRNLIKKYNIFAVNLVGSPGSGKTTLLERTIEQLGNEINFGVIEGDLATSNDADRIKKYNIPVAQINTQGACHLDALMVKQPLSDLPLSEIDVLFIENVGNLVCPAGYDLGENKRVVIMSVPEGDDKPAKYPLIFRKSDAVVITKIDLLDYFDFSIETAYKYAKIVNKNLNLASLSSKTKENFDEWINWLKCNLGSHT